MTTIKTEEIVKHTLCKHCNISYPTTKEFFYTKNNKLALDICKDCKKINSKFYEKTRELRVRSDRKEYFKERRLKIKLEKEALKSIEIL